MWKAKEIKSRAKFKQFKTNVKLVSKILSKTFRN